MWRTLGLLNNADLLVRAALVRKRVLQLSGVGDHYVGASAPSPSTLMTAAPETTNTYILAYGEKEGLAPGERMEIYGNRLRLVRILAYGCPRGVGPAPTLEHLITGGIEQSTLDDLTRQLNVVSARFEEVDSRGGTTSFDGASAVWKRRRWRKRLGASKTPSGAVAAMAPPVAPVWALSRVERGLPHPLTKHEGTPPLGTPLGATDVERVMSEMTRSNTEVVVAEWHKSSTAGTSPAVSASIAEAESLLIENGMCFSSIESAGLRVLRSARMAFMSNVERTANSLIEVQRRRSGEDLRPLAILDVSAIDFSFSHVALQSTLAMGLHDVSQCHINFVPLTDSAARSADAQLASFMRLVVQKPGKALRDPFEQLPLCYFDLGAFTAYLDLRPSTQSPPQKVPHHMSVNGGPARTAPQGRFGQGLSSAEHKMLPRSSLLRHRVDGQEDSQLVETPAVQLSRALASLRQGASMLISFVPSPVSAAAVYHQTKSARRAEVLSEAVAVTHAKACVAEAISRTGRWGCITDEILPAVDAPQGSAISLLVSLD